MLRTAYRSLTAAAGAIALLGMLAACSAPSAEHGAGESDGPGIATLDTAAPAPTDSADPLFAKYGEPVRERLDMTTEEGEAAWRPRDRCIADHTAAPQSTSGEGVGSSSAAVESNAEAEAICLSLAPLPPWEMDVQNPDALRFAQHVVDCLHERGVREVEIGEDDQFGRISFELGGASNDSTSISLGMQHMGACQASASDGATP